MAWVPPWPGIGMGGWARWATRSMGMTTFWTPTPAGGMVGTVVEVAAPVVTGRWLDTDDVEPETTPLLVTT